MFHRRRCIVSDMNALDLIVLGRQLTKIGEEVLRGSGDAAGQDAGGHGERPARASGRPRQTPFLPTGPSLVLRDVFADPGSFITDTTPRTWLPQKDECRNWWPTGRGSQGTWKTLNHSSDGGRILELWVSA